ncbi:hypothetical protein AX774_g6269 [Zancudomyces culisetae]|uniref:Uncharacterized protein n=1 Tax=Zancudomyces culisetae TaxID=1213189 RepID=A0A1R1PH53_ZANCU|nr:hypothetical protein AX774_g6269 [Zancudomyces culisetae]|eukprot:OMH80306.1 hypothetical protein AX774_g6269 [Zancudomyces culisetae]
MSQGDIRETLSFIVKSINELTINQQAIDAKVTALASTSKVPPAGAPPPMAPAVMASTSKVPLGPHVRARKQPIELEAYQELIAFIPSIEENFYKTGYTEQQRVEVYQKFLKNKAMKYKPPEINDEAGQAVKESEANLYNIQVGLAQITRPIDTMAHNIISKGEMTDERVEFLEFLNTIRALIADQATQITQMRIDNMYAKMNLSARPRQIIEDEVDYLVEAKQWEEDMAKQRPFARKEGKFFQKRQQQSVTQFQHQGQRDAQMQNSVVAQGQTRSRTRQNIR